jgi:hypothetical protein
MKSIVLTLLLALTLGMGNLKPEKPLFNQPAQRAGILEWEDAQYILAKALLLDSSKPWICDPEDSIYIAPTEEDIKDLLAFYQHRKEDLPYLAESWDCDNSASYAKVLADLWNLRRFDKPLAGILVGKLYVHLTGCYDALFPAAGGKYIEGYHVLNFIVRSDGKIFFWEPQTNLIAPAEIFIYEGSLEVLRVEF